MTPMEILTVVAILVGPMVGVWLARFLEQLRNKKEARLWVFKTLMATRAATLSVAHVEALNRIELEFNDKRDRDVQAAWRSYHDHLHKFPSHGAESTTTDRWFERKNQLLVKLLHAMAKNLGYGEFDEMQIANSSYSPRVYGDDEWEQRIRGRLLLDVLSGKKEIPVRIVNLPPPNPPADISQAEDKK